MNDAIDSKNVRYITYLVILKLIVYETDILRFPLRL